MKITTCGSARFYTEIEAARGHVVNIPEIAAELPPELAGRSESS